MKLTVKMLVVFAALLTILTPSALASGPIELNVFAAASLTEALTEIAELYKAVQPDAALSFNFDSSGTLQRQIESGAVADVFISASKKQMDTLSEGGYLLEGTRKEHLKNKVVLIIPEDSELGLNGFRDVADERVELVALGNSDVPAGQYAQEIFTALGVWEEVSSKASLGSNVKEVLTQVESGLVDCGVVYATDAATATGVEVVAEAPADSHKPVLYPVAVLKASASHDAARDFLDFLETPEAVKVFEALGFTVAYTSEPAGMAAD